ncbi:MAG: DUF4082 domain-containing protein [Pseudomonadota bacterium]
MLLCSKAATAQTIFTSQTPVVDNISDGVPYELGVRFQSAKAGQITALRYWKAASDTGTHVGTLWSSSGTVLARVTFSGETASGWQQQALPTPVNIQANTTYVASVTVNSYFAITRNGLTTSIINGDLRTVADGTNGVYAGPGVFPANSYQSSNYFRDVVFVASTTPPPANGETVFTNQVPVVPSTSDGVSYELGMKFRASKAGQITAIRHWKASGETGSHVGRIWSATGTLLASITFQGETASGWQTQNFVTPLQIQANTTYIVSVNITSNYPFTNGGLATSVVEGDLSSVADGANGVYGTSGNFPANSYQNSNYFRDIVFVPSTTPPPPTNTETIFTTQVPAVPNATDGVPYELGMKFRASQSGQILAIRHWKASSDTGTHIGRVWSASGALLASVTFQGETASGWQTQNLTTPLQIAANTIYVVSVNVANNFPITGGGLANAVVTGSLSSVADGVNGVFGTSGNFPTSSYQNSNYFRDIVFQPGGVSPPPVGDNPIVTENQRVGTTQWQLTNPVTPSNPEIEGYASATSVNAGSSIAFKISLANAGQYSMDIYRLGYYNGSGGRLVQSIGALSGIKQAACLVTDATTHLIECKWSTSYTLGTGGDWMSGLYVAKLTHSVSGKQTYIWFVVRNDSSGSQLLFQSSFTTFQAYNEFGSTERRSLYTFNSTNGQAAQKVSFDRPFAQVTIDPGLYNNPLFYEYNMIRWLESQGYDVTYVTNLDVHQNASLLRQHKAFLSVGHDEYWSKEMRDGVEQARDAGINLGFFSANTAYWRVRFEPSSSGQANRVMACYKYPEILPDPVAPTYRWRDAPNNRPENALLGVMYIGDDDFYKYGGYDFVVTNASDSYYNNTGLTNGSALTKLVGFEWDAVVNNGFTPTGLVVLSRSTVMPKTIAPGQPNTTTQISNSTRYTAQSGAKVFATGSIQWSWGLDSYGVTDTPRADPRAQQFTVNVLASLGARPATPSSGIIVP